MSGKRPLFIPLKTEYYEAFEQGTKTEEYRRPGGPWNERTCTPGRPVILSCGYGKARRIPGRIEAFSVRHVSDLEPASQEAVRSLYDEITEVVCIKIRKVQ